MNFPLFRTRNSSSWAQAKKTIAEGLAIATGGDQIWVAEGTYAQSITLVSGVTLYGGFAATETLLSQRNIDDNPTTIDASTADAGFPANYAVTMDSITTAALDGFTITGAASYGVYCTGLNNTNTIADCTISGNAGNGVYCCYYSSPAITNCTLVVCQTTNDEFGVQPLGCILGAEEQAEAWTPNSYPPKCV